MTTNTLDLNARMVETILAGNPSLPLSVETALRAVPRHAYLPGADLADSYNPDLAVITKRDTDGTALSCASVPTLVASMLAQLHVGAGHDILEIGAGTGYNAALLRHLSGTGRIVTIDIDPEVTDQARKNLEAAGAEGIEVVTRDGMWGDPGNRTFDRLTATVGAWDVFSAWWRQVRTGGRIVLPLRFRGTTYSVALNHHGTHLTSDSASLCGFVPMIGETGELSADIDPKSRARLHWDADQPIIAQALSGVLDSPAASSTSGVFVGPNDSFDGIWLRLAATDPASCRLQITPEGIEAGLAKPAIPTRTACLAEGESLAYLTTHRTDDKTPRWELGAVGHGPDSEALVSRLTNAITDWDTVRDAVPSITVYPATTRLEALPPGNVITKRDSHLILSI